MTEYYVNTALCPLEFYLLPSLYLTIVTEHDKTYTSIVLSFMAFKIYFIKEYTSV
jgi:hypothetical protein